MKSRSTCFPSHDKFGSCFEMGYDTKNKDDLHISTNTSEFLTSVKIFRYPLHTNMHSRPRDTIALLRTVETTQVTIKPLAVDQGNQNQYSSE
jgi:hypothetical protein